MFICILADNRYIIILFRWNKQLGIAKVAVPNFKMELL